MQSDLTTNVQHTPNHRNYLCPPVDIGSPTYANLRILPTVPQHLSTVSIPHLTFHIPRFRILPTAEFEIQWRLTWPTHTYLIRSQHYNNSINTLLINKCIVFSAFSFSKQKQTKTSTTLPVRVLPAKRSSVSSRNRSVFVSGGIMDVSFPCTFVPGNERVDVSFPERYCL